MGRLPGGLEAPAEPAVPGALLTGGFRELLVVVVGFDELVIGCVPAGVGTRDTLSAGGSAEHAPIAHKHAVPNRQMRSRWISEAIVPGWGVARGWLAGSSVPCF
jgi:hypothetical protein